MNGEIMMERIKYEEYGQDFIFENTDIITDSVFDAGDFDTELI